MTLPRLHLFNFKLKDMQVKTSLFTFLSLCGAHCGTSDITVKTLQTVYSCINLKFGGSIYAKQD